MKLKKLLPVILVLLLLTACTQVDPDRDWEPPTKATTEPKITEPSILEDPTYPIDPTDPSDPTDPVDPVDPSEPEEPDVEFNPDEQDHVHRFGTWKVSRKATCIKEGTKVRSCGCGETETKTYLDDHHYGDWTVKEAATCTQKGIDIRCCTVCGKEETAVAVALGHDEVVTPGTPATCTTPGIKDYIQCGRCSEVLQEATVIEAGHKIVEQKYVAPTCGLPGQTKGSYCSVCLEVFEKSEVIAAKAHNFVTVPGRAATCTEFGLSDSVACSDCNAVMTRPGMIDRLGHTLENGVCIRCGHDCDHGVDPAKPGYAGELEFRKLEYKGENCIDYSYFLFVCKVCGQESKIYGTATSCQMKEYRFAIDPTPDRTGLKVSSCEICGKVEQYVVDAIVHVNDHRFEFNTFGGVKFQHGEGYWEYIMITDERPAGSSAIRYQVLSDTELKVMWLDEKGKECSVVLTPSTDSQRPSTKCVISTDGQVYVSKFGWVVSG